MTEELYRCYLRDLQPQLARAGIRRMMPGELSERQAAAIDHVFTEEVSSVLSPIAVSSPDDFPLLANQKLNVCVRLAPSTDDPAAPRFAVIPFGETLPRFITLPSDGGYEFILLEDVVCLFVGRFFPGEEIVECVPFRLTRNADLGVDEFHADDLVAGMEEVLDARKHSDCVRLEVSQDVTSALFGFLRQTLEVDDADVYSLPGPLDLSALMQLTGLPGFAELSYDPWPPASSPDVDPTKRLVDVLVPGRDLLLYHPFDSFEPVQRFVEEAADDPDVLAIKQILYRTSPQSPMVAALARAAEQGKYVTAIVELKARFDEARNIEWARNLEKAGVHVIYGIKGLKTHAKVCIVVRREPQGIQRYVHFGTGNYNEITARLYTDVSVMTCDDDLGRDAVSFFNAITGYSQPQAFSMIEAAPLRLRERLLEMIEVETQHARQGRRAAIMAKMNSLGDPQVIDALYEASQAGVPIQLNVRGICCLRPRVPGLSDNVRVVSIVDRFLEHSRILYFYHGGDERTFISSADWMPRNLDRRIELLVPVEDTAARRRLIGILETCFRDTVKAREIRPDGQYERILPPDGGEAVRSQEALYRQACDRATRSQRSQVTVFEPHQSASGR
jgi:polyphosphate kinase